MQERDLKDYIVKLNDRNIQRQRETGFTLYAMLGAIIISLFYLLDNIPTFVSIINDSDFLTAATITANTIFILTYYYLIYKIKTRKKSITKIFPFKELIDFTIVDSPIFIACAAICLLNFSSLPYSQIQIQKWYLIIFGSLTGLNLVSPFIMLVLRWLRRISKKKKGFSIEIIDFTVGNAQMTKITAVSLLIYGIGLSCFSIVAISSVNHHIPPSSIAETVKYMSVFFGLLYLINVSIDIKEKEKDNNLLEDFEKEIFFESISNEEIAKRFETEFSGVPFAKWITDKQLEIMDFFKTKNYEFINCSLQITGLANINKNDFPYEYSGRLNDIIKEKIRLLSETNDFKQRLSSNFSSLKALASLNEQETQSMVYVQTELNNNIKWFNSQYVTLSQQIAALQK